MATAGVVAGGAGLLWAAQPAPAHNEAADTAAADKPSHHHRPVYDIDIQSKHFPKEVPAFIEVEKNSRTKYEYDSEVNTARLPC